MFNGQKISELIDKRQVSKKNLYNYVGITKAQLDNYIKGVNIPRVDKLESIANFFKLPISYFFDQETDSPEINIGHHVNGNGNKVSGDITLSECQNELEKLKLLLKEKEERIKDKDDIINFLKQQLNK